MNDEKINYKIKLYAGLFFVVVTLMIAISAIINLYYNQSEENIIVGNIEKTGKVLTDVEGLNKVTFVEGRAFLQRNGKILEVIQGLKVEIGDILVTDDLTVVEIALDNSKVITIGGGTEVLFMELEKTSRIENYSISLKEGTVVADIQSPLTGDSSFTIYSKDLATSIRGTVVSVTVKEDEEEVNFFEGYGLITNVTANTETPAVAGQKIKSFKNGIFKYYAIDKENLNKNDKIFLERFPEVAVLLEEILERDYQKLNRKQEVDLQNYKLPELSKKALELNNKFLNEKSEAFKNKEEVVYERKLEILEKNGIDGTAFTANEVDYLLKELGINYENEVSIIFDDADLNTINDLVDKIHTIDKIDDDKVITNNDKEEINTLGDIYSEVNNKVTTTANFNLKLPSVVNNSNKDIILNTSNDISNNEIISSDDNLSNNKEYENNNESATDEIIDVDEKNENKDSENSEDLDTENENPENTDEETVEESESKENNENNENGNGNDGNGNNGNGNNGNSGKGNGENESNENVNNGNENNGNENNGNGNDGNGNNGNGNNGNGNDGNGNDGNGNNGNSGKGNGENESNGNVNNENVNNGNENNGNGNNENSGKGNGENENNGNGNDGNGNNGNGNGNSGKGNDGNENNGNGNSGKGNGENESNGNENNGNENKGNGNNGNGNSGKGNDQNVNNENGNKGKENNEKLKED